MLDIQTQVDRLRRPGLLVRAARFGLDGYRRNRDLARLLYDADYASAGAALIALLDEERSAEAARLSNDANYAFTRHIDLLTAIMAEARDLRAVSRARDIT